MKINSATKQQEGARQDLNKLHRGRLLFGRTCLALEQRPGASYAGGREGFPGVKKEVGRVFDGLS